MNDYLKKVDSNYEIKKVTSKDEVYVSFDTP